MLTPIQIVTTMLAQHGVATGDDITKLQYPLSQAMMSLSDLTKHMVNFLLASQRLTRSGQGETPYKYFKLFLETVASFPSIGQSLTTYYAQHSAIAQQSVGTLLFPFLEQMKDHLLRNEPSTPFSGAAHGNNKQQNQQNRRKKGPKGNKTHQHPQRSPRWTPHGPALLAATAAVTMAHPTDYSPYVAEIQRLKSALAAYTGSYQPGADFGMPVALQATPMSADRPREFYCWLHGWNNTHHGTNCKIMEANTAYMSEG
jgi:hypothetical protein